MIQNKGQWDSSILFRARNATSDIHIGSNFIQYYFFDKELGFSKKHPQVKTEINLVKQLQLHGIRMDFQNANKTCIIKHKALPHYYNFFKESQFQMKLN